MLRNLNMFPIKIAAGVILFIIAMSVIFSSFFTVPSGHKGIVLIVRAFLKPNYKIN